MSQAAQLKALQGKLARKQKELESSKEQAALFQRCVAQAQWDIKQIQAEIQEVQQNNQKTLIVSEHAMLRYIERVIGISMDDLKARIVSPQLQKQVDQLGDGKYPADGCRVVVKNNTIVTIET